VPAPFCWGLGQGILLGEGEFYGPGCGKEIKHPCVALLYFVIFIEQILQVNLSESEFEDWKDFQDGKIYSIK